MPEERERGHTRFKVRGKTCIFRSRWTRSSPWFLYLRENSSSTSKESKREKSLRPKGGKKGRPIESCIKMERTSQALRPDADEVGMACDAESGRASARRMWRGEAWRGEASEGRLFRGYRNTMPQVPSSQSMAPAAWELTS